MADLTSLPWTEHRMFRAIFEESCEATAVLDHDGHVVQLNRAARDLAGVDVGQLLDPSGAVPSELASFRAELRSQGAARAELRGSADGKAARHLVLEGRACGPRDVVIVRDVAEQRAQAEELRHLRSIEAVGFLTASIVHDFNNLLSVISCAGAALEKEQRPGTTSAALARDILDASERATGLVRQILGRAGGNRAGPQTVSLSAAVAETCGLLRRVVGDGVELELALGEGVGPVLVDRERLENVLLNLAANARDAMPRGGRLRISTANVELGDGSDAPRGCAGGGHVVLTATDDGEGMSPEVRERIFERFFTTKDPGQGTGLGLASAHRFAKESGGCITVRSQVGQGTSVAIYLPRVSAAVSAQTARTVRPRCCG